MPVENEELLSQFPEEWYTDDHLFIVENVRTPKDQRIPHLMAGNAIKGKIIDGHYDIEYVGPNSTSLKSKIEVNAQKAREAASKLLEDRTDEIKNHPSVRLNGAVAAAQDTILDDTKAQVAQMLADGQAAVQQMLAAAQAQAEAIKNAPKAQVAQMLADGQAAVQQMLAAAQAQAEAIKNAPKGKGAKGDGNGEVTDPPPVV